MIRGAPQPNAMAIARAITLTTAGVLQLAGLYAAYATFGAWITLGLYGVGGLSVVLQQVILTRSAPCSPGA
jgi:hypothetical protein